MCIAVFFLSRSFILVSHLVCLGDRFFLLDCFDICFSKVLFGGNVIITYGRFEFFLGWIRFFLFPRNLV